MSFDFLKDILPSLITLITAIIAANLGLKSWRKQLIEKEKRDFAKEVLKKVYEIVDVIKYLRSPLSTSTEGSSRIQESNESKEKTQILNMAYIPYERYTQNRNTFNSFRSLKYEFNIIFDKDDLYLFFEIDQIVNRIISNAFSLGRHYWNRDTTRMTDTQIEDLYKKIEAKENIIYDQGEDDEINKKLVELVKKFEDVCYEAIKKK